MARIPGILGGELDIASRINFPFRSIRDTCFMTLWSRCDAEEPYEIHLGDAGEGGAVVAQIHTNLGWQLQSLFINRFIKDCLFEKHTERRRIVLGTVRRDFPRFLGYRELYHRRDCWGCASKGPFKRFFLRFFYFYF